MVTDLTLDILYASRVALVLQLSTLLRDDDADAARWIAQWTKANAALVWTKDKIARFETQERDAREGHDA